MRDGAARIGLMALGVALAACGPAKTADNAAAPTPAPTVSSVTVPQAIAAAASDPARGDMAAVDARRHGPEIVAFAGAKPGDVVIDLIPGAAYWTKIFARTVGPQGHVYGIWPEPYARVAQGNVKSYGALHDSPDWANVTLGVQPATELTAPAKADLVFTAQNYHDYNDPFMGGTTTATFTSAAFDALKPGGVLLIVDHAAEPGSGLRDTDSLHRIDPETVKQQVTGAGFVFEGAYDVLRNPDDDHRKSVFDPAIRGHTDQFVFRFRKPG